MLEGYIPYVITNFASTCGREPLLQHLDMSLPGRDRIPFVGFSSSHKQVLGSGIGHSFLYYSVFPGSTFPMHCEQGGLGAFNAVVGIVDAQLRRVTPRDPIPTHLTHPTHPTYTQKIGSRDPIPTHPTQTYRPALRDTISTHPTHPHSTAPWDAIPSHPTDLDSQRRSGTRRDPIPAHPTARTTQCICTQETGKRSHTPAWAYRQTQQTGRETKETHDAVKETNGVSNETEKTCEETNQVYKETLETVKETQQPSRETAESYRETLEVKKEETTQPQEPS